MANVMAQHLPARSPVSWGKACHIFAAGQKLPLIPYSSANSFKRFRNTKHFLSSKLFPAHKILCLHLSDEANVIHNSNPENYESKSYASLSSSFLSPERFSSQFGAVFN